MPAARRPAEGARSKRPAARVDPDRPEDIARAREAVARLRRAYPDAHIMLRYSTPWELLVATILSAQSTDVGVNKVTATLFEKYRSVRDYAEADAEEFENDIHATGFFRNKTKSVIGAARMVLEEFGGEVPCTMDELVRLPGVARKTANIVLSNACGVVEGIAVDTHVFRLAHRLGFSNEKDPNKVERDLMAVIDRDDWYAMNYLLIDHGRAVCQAKRPRCDACMLADLCPSAFEFPHFAT